MATGIHSAALTTISLATVGGNPATMDAAGFSALTYISVGEVTSIGDFGAVYNIIKHMPLGNRVVQKLKGSVDMGDGTFDFAISKADAGQVLLKTASRSDSAYPIRIVEQDGTTTYFMALISSFVKKIGTIDNIVAGSGAFNATSDLVEV